MSPEHTARSAAGSGKESVVNPCSYPMASLLVLLFSAGLALAEDTSPTDTSWP